MVPSGTRIRLSREETRIILQPVVSFTDQLAGLAAQKFGKSAKEVAKYINGERKERKKRKR